MKSISGIVKNLKFGAEAGPANKNGIRTVTKIIITIIILNAIIRYLNFNGITPINTDTRNHKTKNLLRQQ